MAARSLAMAPALLLWCAMGVRDSFEFGGFHDMEKDPPLASGGFTNPLFGNSDLPLKEDDEESVVVPDTGSLDDEPVVESGGGSQVGGTGTIYTYYGPKVDKTGYHYAAGQDIKLRGHLIEKGVRGVLYYVEPGHGAWIFFDGSENAVFVPEPDLAKFVVKENDPLGYYAVTGKANDVDEEVDIGRSPRAPTDDVGDQEDEETPDESLSKSDTAPLLGGEDQAWRFRSPLRKLRKERPLYHIIGGLVGRGVHREKEGLYLVDNTELKSKEEGLQFRWRQSTSTDSILHHPRGPVWGAIICGRAARYSDWVKVGTKEGVVFLPVAVDGKTVLKKQNFVGRTVKVAEDIRSNGGNVIKKSKRGHIKKVRPGKVLVVFEDEASTISRWVKTEDLPKLRVVEKVEKEDDKDERDADSEINLMKIGVEAPKVVDYLGLREQVMAFTEVVAGDTVTVFVNGRQRRGRVVQVRDSDRGAKATVKYKSRYFGTSKVEVDVASNKLSVDYGCYSVDDSKARKSDGLAYRLSTNLSDKTVRIARWGSTVIGVDQGDGWVRAVEGGYLPEKIGNERVLFALQEKCHCETNHVRKIGDAFVAKVDMRVDGELVLKGDLSVLKEVLQNGDAWMFFEKLGAVKHVEKKDLAKFEISVDWPGEQCSRRKKEKSKKWLPKVKQVTGSGVTYSTVEVPKEELSEEMRAPVRAFEEEQKRRREEEERRRREAEEKRQMEKEKEEKRQREEEEKRRREAEPDRREVKREMERDDIIWMEEDTE